MYHTGGMHTMHTACTRCCLTVKSEVLTNHERSDQSHKHIFYLSVLTVHTLDPWQWKRLLLTAYLKHAGLTGHLPLSALCALCLPCSHSWALATSPGWSGAFSRLLCCALCRCSSLWSGSRHLSGLHNLRHDDMSPFPSNHLLCQNSRLHIASTQDTGLRISPGDHIHMHICNSRVRTSLGMYL